MSRNIWIGIIVVLVLAVGGWWYFNQPSTPTTSENTQLSVGQTQTYSNSQYGFSIQYPNATQERISNFTVPPDMIEAGFGGTAVMEIGPLTQGVLDGSVFVSIKPSSNDSDCQPPAVMGTPSSEVIGGITFLSTASSNVSNGKNTASTDYVASHGGHCYMISELYTQSNSSVQEDEQTGASANISNALHTITGSFRFNN